MKTLDFETIHTLSKLLSTEGWSISEYKVEDENTISLKIVFVGKSNSTGEEGKNG